MNDACNFLLKSQTALQGNKKTIFQIYNEFRNYIPCFLNMLPIEIKTIIAKKIIKYNKKKNYDTCKTFCEKFDILVSFLGKEYNYVINTLFKEHPKIILTRKIKNNNTVKEFVKNLNLNNITIYSWENGKKKVLCHLDRPEIVERFDFRDCSLLTVHESERVVSRIKYNNIPSYENYYTEGIYINGFKPIQYVNKSVLSEIFF